MSVGTDARVKAICVGGPAQGEVYTCIAQSNWRVVVADRTEIFSASFDLDPMEPTSRKMDTYWLQGLAWVDGNVLWVLIHESLMQYGTAKHNGWWPFILDTILRPEAKQCVVPHWSKQ